MVENGAHIVAHEQIGRHGSHPRAEYGGYGQKGKAGAEALDVVFHVGVETNAYAYAKQQAAQGHKAGGAAENPCRHAAAASGKHAKNEESYYDKASFHRLFPPFAVFHNAHARAQLPNVANTDNTMASTPRVGRAEMSCLLLPTSMPSIKRRSQMSHVVILEFQMLMAFRRAEKALLVRRV